MNHNGVEYPDDFLPLAYKCRLCHGDFTTYYDPAGAGFLNLDMWRGALACDRCFDYRAAFLKQVRRVTRICWSLMEIRKGSDGDKKNAAAMGCYDSIEATVKELASVFGNYFHRPAITDMGVVEAIYNSPTNAVACIVAWRSTFGHVRLLPAPTTPPRASAEQECPF
jgi:hypothetical protein